LSPPASIPRPTIAELASGVLARDRAALARAISLVESSGPRHAQRADELLRAILPHACTAIRVGVTGVPGAGKSTLIEKLGLMLCDQGRRVAVLAIDPSSVVTGGSILGDRTRMGKLAAHPNAFIRPSPSAGHLGGVARRTREASILCDAAGFDIILIETVGVGQSETIVADMTDCLLSLALPGAGDELQGVKRGILEVVDVIAVNKADADNLPRAQQAARELASALRVLRSHDQRAIPVLTCSAATGSGVAEVWDAIQARVDCLRESGALAARRREQAQRWLDSLIVERLHDLLAASPAASAALARARELVRHNHSTPSAAAQSVIDALAQEFRTTTTRATP
jgi:LAO/AO transport system kinase